MKTFKQWLEDAGEVRGGLNSDDAAYCSRGIKSRFGQSAYSKDLDGKKSGKGRLLGFMKKMKNK